MIEVRRTARYDRWFSRLRDVRGKAIILTRINRVMEGDFGDHAAVGEDVFELRIFFGPGYRVYYKRVGDEIVILLAGGDKDSQDRDIGQAKRLAGDL